MKTTMHAFLFILLSCLIISCKSGPKGDSATTGEAATTTTAKGTAYTVNKGSLVNWEGAKPTGKHDGTINISSGSLFVNGKDITGGKFTIDMTSLTCTDLAGDGKGKLEGHLKSGDFFDVENHKTSTFEITKVTKLSGDNTASHMIFGNLTLKGITKNVGFKSIVTVKDGSLSATTPQFKIDRTKWNVKYGSKKFFDNLKDKFINDEIGLSISLTAKK